MRMSGQLRLCRCVGLLTDLWLQYHYCQCDMSAFPLVVFFLFFLSFLVFPRIDVRTSALSLCFFTPYSQMLCVISKTEKTPYFLCCTLLQRMKGERRGGRREGAHRGMHCHHEKKCTLTGLAFRVEEMIKSQRNEWG